ncbi:MAG: hypothetical protein ACYC9L_06695 [Sulfuricaulis sp.]
MTQHQFECGNCAWKGTASQLHPIDDIGQRVSVGEIHPAGQCPQCACLIEAPDKCVPDYTVRNCVHIHAQRLRGRTCCTPEPTAADALALLADAQTHLRRLGECEELPRHAEFRHAANLLTSAERALAMVVARDRP